MLQREGRVFISWKLKSEMDFKKVFLKDRSDFIGKFSSQKILPTKNWF